MRTAYYYKKENVNIFLDGLLQQILKHLLLSLFETRGNFSRENYVTQILFEEATAPKVGHITEVFLLSPTSTPTSTSWGWRKLMENKFKKALKGGGNAINFVPVQPI